MSALSLTSPRYFGSHLDGGQSLISTVSAVFTEQAHQARTALVQVSIQIDRHLRAITLLGSHAMPRKE